MLILYSRQRVKKSRIFVQEYYAFNYIDARDLGQAVELCINKDGLGFEIFNVSNDQNSVDLNTQEIIKNYYPNVPLKYELGSQECLYSNKKIKNMLGFSPVYDWQKQLQVAY